MKTNIINTMCTKCEAVYDFLFLSQSQKEDRARIAAISQANLKEKELKEYAIRAEEERVLIEQRLLEELKSLEEHFKEVEKLNFEQATIEIEQLQNKITEDVVVFCSMLVFIIIFVTALKIVPAILSQEINSISKGLRLNYDLTSKQLSKVKENINFYNNKSKFINSLYQTILLEQKLRNYNSINEYSTNIDYIVKKKILNDLVLKYTSTKNLIIETKIMNISTWSQNLDLPHKVVCAHSEILKLTNNKFITINSYSILRKLLSYYFFYQIFELFLTIDPNNKIIKEVNDLDFLEKEKFNS